MGDGDGMQDTFAALLRNRESSFGAHRVEATTPPVSGSLHEEPASETDEGVTPPPAKARKKSESDVC